jgi:hypothetical protein
VLYLYRIHPLHAGRIWYQTSLSLSTYLVVGYSVAAYLEVHNWKTTHFPKQLNAELIYKCGREYKADTISGTKPEYCLINLKQKNVFCGEIVKFQSFVNMYTCDVIKSMVHQYGVLIMGFNVTDKWFDLKDGIIQINKQPNVLGLHCVLCCGYCKDGLYIQNSWGIKEWGHYGYAILPWELLTTQFCYGVYVDDLKINNTQLEDFYI